MDPSHGLIGADSQEKLVNGGINRFEPVLTLTKARLEELLDKQNSLEELASAELRQLEQLVSDAHLQALFDHIARTHAATLSRCAEMRNLLKRVNALCIRAEAIKKAAASKTSS